MKKSLPLIALSMLLSAQIFSQTNTWDGSSNFNWNTAANWSLNVVPTSAHDVVIPDGFNVTVNTAAVCASLTINGGPTDNTVTISGGNSLTVSGAITINAGTGTGGGGDDKVIVVGANTLTSGSIIMAATTNDAIDSEITISSGTVTVTGDITMNGTAARNAIRFSGAGTLNVGGSVSSGGDIVPNGTTQGLVNYNGTIGTQTVKADTYADITFSGGAAKVIAAGGIVITDVATFTSGIVTSTSTNLVTFNDNATATGASNSSFVHGPVRKIGNDVFTFPTGKTVGGFHAIGISAPAAGSQFTAEYTQDDPITLGPISGSSSIGSLSTCDYWSLTRDAGSTNVNVTLFWNYSLSTQSCAYNPTGSLVCNLNGSTEWDNVTASTVNGGSSTSSGSVTRNAVTTFNFFTIGNGTGDASLPVKFGDIKGFVKDNGVQLDWNVHTEDNVTHYDVERSADGRSFTVAGQVAAKKLSGTIDYSFFDAGAAPGNNFYRIKNVDKDGRSSYSVVIRVSMGKSSGSLSVYPNPVTGNHISLQTPDLSKGSYMIRIFNNSGQQIFQRSFNHGGGVVNQTIPLPVNMQKGIYSLQLLSGESKLVRNFVVQ